MYMTQPLLPLWSNDGERFPHSLFEQVRDELVREFGGLTACARTPARGLWRKKEGATVHDDIIVYEIMVKDLDEDWWAGYRKKLEQRFSQNRLVIRAADLHRNGSVLKLRSETRV